MKGSDQTFRICGAERRQSDRRATPADRQAIRVDAGSIVLPLLIGFGAVVIVALVVVVALLVTSRPTDNNESAPTPATTNTDSPFAPPSTPPSTPPTDESSTAPKATREPVVPDPEPAAKRPQPPAGQSWEPSNLKGGWKTGVTSESFAAAIHEEWLNTPGNAPNITVYSPVTDRYYRMSCSYTHPYVACVEVQNTDGGALDAGILMDLEAGVS